VLRLKPMQGLPEGTLQVRVAARQGPLRETLAGSEGPYFVQ
jgi:hypothetical protein